MLDKYALFKVMNHVLSHAATKFSVRETAKKSKVSTFAAKHSLDYLFSKNMLTRKKIGNTYQYQANLDSYLTRQWKITFSLEELHDAKIVENFLSKSRNITSIILYGSAALGRDDEHSDLDIIVVGDLSLHKKRDMISVVPKTRRELNLQIYTISEWRKKAEKDKVFYEQAVMNSVVLYGEKPVVI